MAELTHDPLQGARLILMLRQQGITDSRVLSAIETVSRADFVGPALADLAFEDCVLPIDCGQSMGRPSEIAAQLQMLGLGADADMRVLLIGAGTGYVAALIAALGAQVFGLERFSALADLARENMQNQGVERVVVAQGDGLAGWPKEAPFDRIVLTGCLSEVPQPLIEQLTPEGFCVGFIGDETRAELAIIQRNGTISARRAVGSQIALSRGVSKRL